MSPELLKAEIGAALHQDWCGCDSWDGSNCDEYSGSEFPESADAVMDVLRRHLPAALRDGGQQ